MNSSKRKETVGSTTGPIKKIELIDQPSVARHNKTEGRREITEFGRHFW